MGAFVSQLFVASGIFVFRSRHFSCEGLAGRRPLVNMSDNTVQTHHPKEGTKLLMHDAATLACAKHAPMLARFTVVSVLDVSMFLCSCCLEIMDLWWRESAYSLLACENNPTVSSLLGGGGGLRKKTGSGS